VTADQDACDEGRWSLGPTKTNETVLWESRVSLRHGCGWARMVEGVNQRVRQGGPRQPCNCVFPSIAPRFILHSVLFALPPPRGNWQRQSSSFPRSLVVLLPGFEALTSFPSPPALLSSPCAFAPFLSFFLSFFPIQ
jgi:hypothetical protein